MPGLPRRLSPFLPLIKRCLMLATRRAAPLTVRASRLFGDAALPQDSAESTVEIAAQRPEAGVVVREVFPAELLRRTLPTGLPASYWPFAAERSVTTTPALVATIPGGRVAGNYGAVMTDQRTLLFDLSPYWGRRVPEEHPVFLRLRLPPLEHVPGTVAVLTCRGVNNYCHFLLEVIPRLEILEAAGLSSQIQRYVVNRSLGFQKELLGLAGISGQQVVDSSEHPHVRADLLVAPSVPDLHFRIPGWVVRSIRSRLMPPGIERPHRRIYITRDKSQRRVIENEDEVLPVVLRHGLVPLAPEKLSVAEQILLFAEAEVIVAAHGAALANLAFCPPGSAVIELFAPDYVNVCFWGLACHVDGLRYRYLIGDGRERAPGSHMGGVGSDIRLDVAKLDALLSSVASVAG